MTFPNCRRNCCAKGGWTKSSSWTCPATEERKEIFRIHLTKRGRDAAQFDLEALAEASQDFSGAEIEEAINSALYDAFYAKQELTTDSCPDRAVTNRAAGENDGRTNQPAAQLGGRPRPQCQCGARRQEE